MSRYLSFYLNDHEQAVIETTYLSEIIYVEKESITPVFAMNESVMGVFNYRGDIVCLVDLGKILGFLALSKYPNLIRYGVLIMKYENNLIGLVCQKIGKIFPEEYFISSKNYHNLQNKTIDFCIQQEKYNKEGDIFLDLNFLNLLAILNSSNQG